MSWEGKDDHYETCFEMFVEEHGREPNDTEMENAFDAYVNSFPEPDLDDYEEATNE